MNQLFKFLAVIGLLFFATPWVAAASAALMAVLHIWFDFSWWWMAVPGGLFVAWAAFMIWARKGVV